jgi:hypothetical protein
MGAGTELMFVKGHSRDDSHGAIEQAGPKHPERGVQVHRQIGEGGAILSGSDSTTRPARC